jgi:hypothetical protein
VIVLEKTIVCWVPASGGICNNGRFTAAEEMIATAAASVPVDDHASRHTNIEFGPQHANLYDVALMEPMVRRYLLIRSRAMADEPRPRGEHADGRIESVCTESGETVEADVCEATGTAAPRPTAAAWQRCVMCISSLPGLGRPAEHRRKGREGEMGRRADGTPGAFSGSASPQGLGDPGIVAELNCTGVAMCPFPRT